MGKIIIRNIVLLIILNSVTLAQFEKSDELSSSSKSSIQAISVTIGGSFIVNGSFPASPFERVDQFVTRIFNLFRTEGTGALNTKEDIADVLQKAENYAKRFILLKRIDGKEFKIDLEKFRTTGDFLFNPYLKNDDILIFPALDLDRNYFTIDGAVNKPVKIQFVDGDKLSDALLLAQGVNKAYENVTEAEITRLSYDGNKEEVLKFNINDDVELQRGDRIRVLADETNRKDFKVLVIGDVNKPGFIPITKNSTTIKNVIEKAGGFKPDADLNRTELIKVNDPHRIYKYKLLSKGFEQDLLTDDKYLKELYNIFDNKNIESLLMQRAANISLEDSLGFRIDNVLRLWKQESLIDFSKINNDNFSDGNYILEDGDIIVVPQKNDLVYVFGQVASIGYQKYEEGKDAVYYINRAGGLTIIAKDIDEAILIKGKSRNWISIEDTEAKVEAGDYIWVPKKQTKDFKYYIDLIAPIASVIGTIATIALLIVQLNRK